MNDAVPRCDVVVVGAGLSGLTCAHLLCEAGLHTIVLEASERVGGRIHSVAHSETDAYIADLGPTWVWPPYQPNVTEWLARLNVETFAQYEEGQAVLDMDENGPVQHQPLPGQHGIRRVTGGPQALVGALSRKLPTEIVKTGHTVTRIDAGTSSLSVSISGPEITTLETNYLVIAVPPRVAAQNISLTPALDSAMLATMERTPTWMATQAKAVALYERPFWRAHALSGRVASRAGPLAEIHDHCSADGDEAALFGFVGWPHTARHSHADALRDAIAQQLIRCFGAEGGAFSALHIEDWARNQHICSDLDLSQPPAHPDVTSDILRAPQYDGRLFLSVAETATQSPGLIDGALSIGTDTATRIIDALH